MTVNMAAAASHVEPGSEAGGQAIAGHLARAGISRGFCVPGESYLGLLAALDEQGDDFDLVVCRHEGGAAYMAEAYGRLTGKPGLCLVTRGPGACNAMIGVSTAWQESTPMILIIGHVSTGTAERFAFQEVDPRAMFSGISKWVGVVERAADIPHMITRAIRISVSGRPGPVVLAVPDDALLQDVPVQHGPKIERPARVPAPDDMERVAEMLGAAKSPLVVLGGNGWDRAACRDVTAFAARFDLPVTTTFRRNDLIDNRSNHYIGSFGPVPHPALIAQARQSDLIMLLGGRLSEIETGRYQFLCAPEPHRRFIHAAPLDDEFGEVLAPDLAMTTDVRPLAAALAALPAPAATPWSAKRRALRESFERYHAPVDFGALANPAVAVRSLQAQLPDGAVICAGAGNYSHFILRHHQYHHPGTLLAPLSAPMGYSVPSAICAAMVRPDTEAVAYVGDGCFFMNPQELVLAVKRSLPVTVVLFNNGIYGSIRMHQELSKTAIGVATTLDNPDFQSLARAFGMASRRLTDPAEVGQAYCDLRAGTSGPILIELMTDPEIINTQMTISQIREA